jgi:hypothetical protein
MYICSLHNVLTASVITKLHVLCESQLYLETLYIPTCFDAIVVDARMYVCTYVNMTIVEWATVLQKLLKT